MHVFCNIMGFPDLSFFNPDNALHQFRTSKYQPFMCVCCVPSQVNELYEHSHSGRVLRGHIRVYSIAGPMDRACNLFVTAMEHHDDNPSDPRARYVLWVLIFNLDPEKKDEQQATNRAIAFCFHPKSFMGALFCLIGLQETKTRLILACGLLHSLYGEEHRVELAKYPLKT